MLHNGLYEQIINKGLDSELSVTDKLSQTAPIDSAEASKVLAKYVAEIVEKGLNNVKDNGGDLNSQVDLVNRIVSTIMTETKEADFDTLSVAERAEQLLALFDKKNNVLALDEKAEIIRPETSIAQSSLFTGAIHEPQMFTELKKEIVSCNRIDMLVSFIKWSGLRLIMDELTTFTQNGGQLRIITTSYMGATDVKAIEELRKLPNTLIKVSYDTKRTRLHAKTYVFYRDTGFTTAYVGPSNLSNAAISSGLEWNVKVTKKDLPETIDKIAATFESYWNSNEFEYYNEDQKERLARALKAEKYFDTNNAEIYTMDIQPYSYQQEILDKLDAERNVRGYYHNLVVAATGTGKTVISALDYKRYRKQNAGRPCRLLFVAHREEILKQSLYTFRAVLKDANFGEMFVGSYKPDSIDNLFMSIQTFNSQDFTSKTTPGFYDYIIVDEFHHAAAPTYQKLLSYYQPKILLGLTATPERMDGKSILPYFNNRIAAEIRLPEAIDRKLLCPFQYFGVTDTVDLDKLKWANGGYDKSELSRMYTLSGMVANRRADLVVSSLLKYVTDIDDVKGLGFCVTIEHAEFMSDYFNAHGIPSMFLTGKSPDEERKEAKNRLVSGDVRFIFVVDIYNEGVDIPEVNTVLFLRPTESLTVFLQQLGRGLRLSEDKECLTVLDFIGQANRKYNFEDTENGYELISGHRRLAACRALGMSTMPVIVRNLTDEEAIITMVDSNLQREHILPSEKAFAYKMKLEAIKHQGKASTQVAQKLSAEIVGEASGESKDQVRRYIRLTNLIPDILKLVDEGRIALTPAVELSYLNNHEQEVLNEIMSCDELTPSLSQAQRLRKLSEDYTLTDSGISQIMSEIKGNQKEYLKIEVEPLRRYFPPGTTAKQMQTTMIRAMEFYRQHTQSRADKSKEREER